MPHQSSWTNLFHFVNVLRAKELTHEIEVSRRQKRHAKLYDIYSDIRDISTPSRACRLLVRRTIEIGLAFALSK